MCVLARAIVVVLVYVAALGGDTVAAPVNTGTATTVSNACRITADANNRAVAIFRRMLPVLQSPRCANCHGAMDVGSPTTTHEGGRIDLTEAAKPDRDGRIFTECQDCHTRASEEVEKQIAESERTGPKLSPQSIRDRYNAGHWRPVRFTIAKWGGLPPLQICRALKSSTFAGPRMLPHLRDDVLIGLAFEGKRGQDYLDPEPPPMSRASFTALFQEWMTAQDALRGWQESGDCGCVEVSLTPSPTGNWDTTEGAMRLTQVGPAIVRGTYTQDNGRIDGTMQGGILTGFWAEDGSDRQCATTRLNSRYWGRVRWTFARDRFTGTWGYCDDPPTRPWNGTRR
jgi:hypothetical protein